jgi:hypothetical protein
VEVFRNGQHSVAGQASSHLDCLLSASVIVRQRPKSFQAFGDLPGIWISPRQNRRREEQEESPDCSNSTPSASQSADCASLATAAQRVYLPGFTFGKPGNESSHRGLWGGRTADWRVLRVSLTRLRGSGLQPLRCLFPPAPRSVGYRPHAVWPVLAVASRVRARALCLFTRRCQSFAR